MLKIDSKVKVLYFKCLEDFDVEGQFEGVPGLSWLPGITSLFISWTDYQSFWQVLEALGSITFPYVYPDPESRRLRAALAQDSGLEPEYILAGCGADELIDLIMR